jgi:hypothetical protein
LAWTEGAVRATGAANTRATSTALAKLFI